MQHRIDPLPPARPAATPAIVRYSLAGCGVVGSALLRLLEARAVQIEAQHGLRFELQQVLVRDRSQQRDASLPKSQLTSDVAHFSAQPADMLVEAIGGFEPALGLIQTALASGRDVVTANKAVLAEHGQALQQLADETGAGLEFEAAVGGGMPLIHVLRDSLGQADVQSIRGILNGTSNFILTRLAEGLAYGQALQRAQQAGFAEADPTRDLDGTDAADKIRILAWLAFGIDPAGLSVDTSGILPDPDALAANARAQDGVVRLLAECSRSDGQVRAWVRPVVVAADSVWAQTRDEANLVSIDTRFNGTVQVHGLGAGGYPTASALLADMLRRAKWRQHAK